MTRYTLSVALLWRSRGPHWVFRSLLVLAGLGAPFLALNLSYRLIDPSLDYFGFGLATWFFLVACSTVSLTVLTLVCYRFLPVFKGASSRPTALSVWFAALSPIVGAWLYFYIPSVIHNAELKRDYMMIPEWITDQQTVLGTTWQENPSLQPWHSLLPQLTKFESVRHDIFPKVMMLSSFDPSIDDSVTYYKKSEMLRLSEVEGHTYLTVTPPINLDVAVTFFRAGETRIDGVSASIYDLDVGKQYVEVVSCKDSGKTQQIILRLTTHFPDVGEQVLTLTGEVGDETLSSRHIRAAGRFLIITVPSPTYDQQAVDTGNFSNPAGLYLSREEPPPRVSLRFHFWAGLRACLRAERGDGS